MHFLNMCASNQTITSFLHLSWENPLIIAFWQVHPSVFQNQFRFQASVKLMGNEYGMSLDFPDRKNYSGKKVISSFEVIIRTKGRRIPSWEENRFFTAPVANIWGPINVMNYLCSGVKCLNSKDPPSVYLYLRGACTIIYTTFTQSKRFGLFVDPQGHHFPGCVLSSPSQLCNKCCTRVPIRHGFHPTYEDLASAAAKIRAHKNKLAG